MMMMKRIKIQKTTKKDKKITIPKMKRLKGRVKKTEENKKSTKGRSKKAEKKQSDNQESNVKRKQQKKKEDEGRENKLLKLNSPPSSSATTTTISSSSSSSSSLGSDVPCSSLSDSSSNDFVLQNLDIIPVSVRLDALFALREFGYLPASEYQVESIMYVLVESLELKEGEEEEYERKKLEDLSKTEKSETYKREKGEKEGKGEIYKCTKTRFTDCDYHPKYQRIRKTLIEMIDFMANKLYNYHQSFPESIIMKTVVALRRLTNELLTELDNVEQEMKDAVKREIEKEMKEYETFSIPKGFDHNHFAQSESESNFYPQPRISDYVNCIELEFSRNHYCDLLTKCDHDFVIKSSIRNSFNIFMSLQYKVSYCFTPYKFHHSLSSQRFYYIAMCLFTFILEKSCSADKIVLDPLFCRLMEKMSTPFPLSAPISIKGIQSNMLVPRSLESVQYLIELLVITTLTSVVKELPYIFEIGYVSQLIYWMAPKSLPPSNVFCLAIKVLHEKCVAFMLPSRQNRLNFIEQFIKSIAKRNKYFKEHSANLWNAPPLAEWENISQLDSVICLPSDINEMNRKMTNQPCFKSLISMDEEIEEIEKEDDTGTYLLRLLDDAMEESGMRDLVEPVLIPLNLQLFWMLPRVTPNKINLAKIFDNFDYPVHFPAPSDVSHPINERYNNYQTAFGNVLFSNPFSTFATYPTFL
ncbi:uncharacterized protein MONOS_12136 [Monocercomonoides exilis]|uniref:uncharacterized protein n=1 Tax=Monocercomonoides exilis TaxID=2049356 RepID=UPI00355AA71E|nr:hypothetical protein MONOS_12136 [Monocercomonoides exilis]|eukprot:MONOS_12136.1-p1 / transcript=MONOS_12136.1 / gene=MONOS_12136 / organism=Monocercomonoides_exilis_PA203 / gene_product=unspecified product / transcript_product=unspecified product / location=Mono_scaffold00650:33153-35853(+) / protein_length=697 / sequence_SO=supercontig / SO=protein_coding / is_pseudo=false